MVQALCALINFIYIARHDVIDSNSLAALEDALERFHKYRKIFEDTGVMDCELVPMDGGVMETKIRYGKR
jgi:hypothetical protein